MALHGHKKAKGTPQLLPTSHGQVPADLEQRVRSGGRVASQSPEDQHAYFKGMLEAAMRPKTETYFEHPDGRRVSPEEMVNVKPA